MLVIVDFVGIFHINYFFKYKIMTSELAEKLMGNLSVKAEEGEEEVC